MNVQCNLEEKKSFTLTKPKTISLLKLAHHQNAKKMGLLNDSIFQHDITMKSSTSFANGTPKPVENSIEQFPHQSQRDFDDLHTDDSTDHEDDQTELPYWCLKGPRKAIVISQATLNSKIIDSFFDSKPQTIHSQKIFEKSSPIKRRRSTAEWNAPVRYSSLPKY